MSERPQGLTVYCVFGFVCCPLGLILGILGILRSPGIETLWMIFTAILSFIIFVGFWNMKKWALIIHTALFALNLLIPVYIPISLFGILMRTMYLLPLIIVIWGFKNYERFA